jgi:hypothetical protein
MKYSDFYIGREFFGTAGFRWRCTDVGTRTILAIQLDHDNPNWYQGPPYIAKETVFDESEIMRCHLTLDEGIAAALREHETSGHPGYPAEAVSHMMEIRFARRYPHGGILRFDRRRADGEILHPYAGHGQENAWIVELYLPFQNSFDTMPEDDFIALPRATAADIRQRAAQSKSTKPDQPPHTSANHE